MTGQTQHETEQRQPKESIEQYGSGSMVAECLNKQRSILNERKILAKNKKA